MSSQLPPNDLIINLIKDAEKMTQRLEDSDLKNKIMSHFKILKSLINKKPTANVEGMIKKLSIAVIDAISFQDMEELALIEIEIATGLEKAEMSD